MKYYWTSFVFLAVAILLLKYASREIVAGQSLLIPISIAASLILSMVFFGIHFFKPPFTDDPEFWSIHQIKRKRIQNHFKHKNKKRYV